MKQLYIILLITILIPITCLSQNNIRLMFYNCENFFDCENDSIKNDDEFTPEGKKRWSKSKYYTKKNQIFKVITAVGEWNPPALIGLCEIENRYVLDQLVYKTPLSKYNYQVSHFESPDRRGIDVGLLYRPDLFKPITEIAIPIDFGKVSSSKTRDILYVKGIIKNTDTLHVFINHWPSRWGGQINSEPKRLFVAQVLKNTVDSIFETNSNALIIITGDFNDFPNNKSLTDVLEAQTKTESIESDKLYNLSYPMQFDHDLWSHKFHEEKGILDQIIVSGALLNKSGEIYTESEFSKIFNADFLLEKDDKNFGLKPFRTYLGYKYHGGFSDHLPVYIDLFKK